MEHATTRLEHDLPDANSGNPSRDRLPMFRRLFLVLAAVTLLGMTLVRIPDLGHDPARLALMGGAASLLVTLWIVGYRERLFRHRLLPLELILLLAFMAGLREGLPWLGAAYIALQFRGLYGTFRDTLIVSTAYVVTYLAGAAFVLGPASVIRPAILVQVFALGFSAYVVAALAHVLRKDSERAEALRRSEDRYRLLFDNNPWPMFVLDSNTLGLLDVNAAALTQYGFSREQLLQMNVRDLRAPDERQTLQQLRPEIASDRRFTHQTRQRRADGSEFDVEISSVAMKFAGRHTRVAVCVDISEREAAQRALRDSEQRFRSVADCLREAVLITDAEDRIVIANARVRDVLGYEPSEVIGQNATELLLPPSRSNEFRDRLRQRLGGESELYEVELLRGDGRRIFAEVSASPYRDASGRIIGTLGAISDISDRKRLEDRLRQATRLEAVGQLAGGVAHDFNNLLTVINCHTELLIDDLDPADSARLGVTEIARAAQRGAELTRQLLAFSRKQMLQPRYVSLANVVADAGPMLSRLAGANVRVAVESDGSACPILADPAQLENVLVTLVRNAREAMRTGGEIRISTQLHEHGTGAGTGTQEMPVGSYALLRVSDTGHGMGRDVLKRVFEPFFTTKGPGEGTGLSLAGVYGIVRQSGGFVDVESTPDSGTTFRIYLPSAEQAADAMAERIGRFQPV